MQMLQRGDFAVNKGQLIKIKLQKSSILFCCQVFMIFVHAEDGFCSYKYLSEKSRNYFGPEGILLWLYFVCFCGGFSVWTGKDTDTSDRVLPEVIQFCTVVYLWGVAE